MEPDFWEKKNICAKNGEIGVKNMHFLVFLGKQPLDFSDFWYEISLIYYFKHGIGSFARLFFFCWKCENVKKDAKNMRFRAFLGNHPLDFSNIWYETSLIYYFKYGICSYTRKTILISENIKTCEESHIISHDRVNTFCSKNVAGM